MATIEIKHRWSGAVLFSCDLSAEVSERSLSFQMGFAVTRAVESGANLRGANLSGANLSGADLSDASLRDASLRDADLSDADLRDANLSGANLRGANLRGANLRGANLSGASLRDADLSDASLSDANLSDASLRGASLRGANLSGANLSGADLSDADLSGADLTPIRDDLWAVLSAAPKEVDGLRKALAEGRVDGSMYEGECACLLGTIANVRGVGYLGLDGLAPNSYRPIERFFLAIKRGDTPENNSASKLALSWCDEWVGNMRAAFGPQS